MERKTELTVNHRRLVPGTEVTISGVPGRFRFRYVDVHDNGRLPEITVVGGRTGYSLTRTFTVDRIRRVHRIARTRASA